MGSEMCIRDSYQAEKFQSEGKDKLDEADGKVLTEAVAEAKTHLESDDKDKLEAAAKELTDKIMPIGAKLYETADEAPEGEAVDADEAKKSGKSNAKSKKTKKTKDEPVEGEVVED